MEYIRAGITDAPAAARLACMLWSDHTADEFLSEFRRDIPNADTAVFLCRDNGSEIGFAQFSLRREYVEGTESGPVGYLEGIFVAESYRRHGIAARLLRMGEEWAAELGCRQMASDCELANDVSFRFHLGCGYAEANRIICFVKDIVRK